MKADPIVSKMLHKRIRLHHCCTVFMNENRAPGRYEIAWDGRNERGEKVQSGIYIVKMQAGQFQKTRKMILIE